MILASDVSIELEIHPKFPESADKDRQLHIVESMVEMLNKGKVFTGASEASAEARMLPTEAPSILLQIEVKSGKITIS